MSSTRERNCAKHIFMWCANVWVSGVKLWSFPVHYQMVWNQETTVQPSKAVLPLPLVYFVTSRNFQLCQLWNVKWSKPRFLVWLSVFSGTCVAITRLLCLSPYQAIPGFGLSWDHCFMMSSKTLNSHCHTLTPMYTLSALLFSTAIRWERHVCLDII